MTRAKIPEANRQSVVYCSHCKLFQAYVTEESIKRFKKIHKKHFVYVASDRYEKLSVASMKWKEAPLPLNGVIVK